MWCCPHPGERRPSFLSHFSISALTNVTFRPTDEVEKHNSPSNNTSDVTALGQCRSASPGPLRIAPPQAFFFLLFARASLCYWEGQWFVCWLVCSDMTQHLLLRRLFLLLFTSNPSPHSCVAGWWSSLVSLSSLRMWQEGYKTASSSTEEIYIDNDCCDFAL